MKIIDRLRRWRGKASSNGHGKRGFSTIPSSGIFGDPYFLREGFPEMGAGSLENAYTQHSWTYAGVRAIARAVAAVKWQALTGSREQPTVLDVHPMLALLDRPSALLTRAQVWRATVTYLYTAGSCAWLMFGRTELVAPNEWPVEVMPLNGRALIPRAQDGKIIGAGVLRGRPASWEINLGSEGVLRVEPHQVARFSEWSPRGIYHGQPIIDPATLAIDGDYQAALWNSAFFRNACDPGGWLTVQSMLSDEQFKQFRRHWDEQHKGAAKRGKTAFLEGGATFQPNPRSQRDMEFSTLREMLRDETIAVLGVSPATLGITDDLSYANHEGQERIQAEQTVIPMLEEFGDVLWRDICSTRDGGKVWMDFDRRSIRALNSDYQVRVQNAVALAGLGWTPNQLNERLDLGLPAAPNGDVPITQGDAFDPFAVTADEEPADAAEVAEAGGVVADTALNGAQIASLVDIVAQVSAGTLPAASAVGIIAASFPTISPEDASAMVSPAASAVPAAAQVEAAATSSGRVNRSADRKAKRLALWRRDVRVRRPSEEVVKRAVARWYAQVAQDTVALFDRLTRSRAALTKDQVAAIEDLRERWDAKIAELLAGPLRNASKASAKQVQTEIGALIDMANPKILELHADRIAEMVRVSRRLQAAIRDRMIALATEENASISWQREQLKEFFAGNTGRALRVARTETGMMQEGTRAVAYEEHGIERIEWVSSNDWAVRDSHERVDGEEIKRGDTFSNGLHYPMERGAPAEEVINCRCSAIAVV